MDYLTADLPPKLIQHWLNLTDKQITDVLEFSFRKLSGASFESSFPRVEQQWNRQNSVMVSMEVGDLCDGKLNNFLINVAGDFLKILAEQVEDSWDIRMDFLIVHRLILMRQHVAQPRHRRQR